MNVQYACTHIEKDVEVDELERSCVGRRTCVMLNAVNITADSLPSLLTALSEYLGLEPMDDLFIPDVDAGQTEFFGYSCHETNDGDTPSEDELAAWKAGKLTMYLADYGFRIEKRTVEPVLLDEFRAADIKFH